MAQDFQVFAGGGGANVITQAQYLALAASSTGFQSGIASSAQLNKVWRQSSIISSMIGQFISGHTGAGNAVDDGTTTTLLANFITSLQSVTLIKLTSALNLYVNASTGVDTNNGTSISTPFKTIQAAINAGYTGYAYNNFALIINLAAGTYTGAALMTGQPTGCSSVQLLGNPASPATVVISVTTANAVYAQIGCFLILNGLTIQATGVSTTLVGIGCGISCSQSWIQVQNCVFGTCGTAQVNCGNGGVITMASTTFTGTNAIGIAVQTAGLVWMVNGAFTVTTPTYSAAFASANTCGVIDAIGATFSGTATGVRYSITLNGVAVTNGGGATFFPGNSAGATASGGQYN